MKKIITSATGRIAIALLLGILFGLIANYVAWTNFTINWIKPVGTAFIQMLRAIAIPLIIVSLTKGIIELKDLSQLSKLGGKTILYYLATTHLGQLFYSLNQVIMKVIDFIMLLAAPAVFALMAALIVEIPKSDLLFSMLIYVGVVVLGLTFLVFGFYPLLVKKLTGFSGNKFLRGISKAQLVGISSSSSAATLPVTLDCVRDNLKVRNEIASFILPIGANCNMDGTGMYQAVAAIFIAQLYGLELSFFAQAGIVATATLGSIGAAAVPGGGIVMLTIVLEQAGLPLSGLGLILALDRPLDMLRTAVNITSDAAGALILNHFKN